MILLQLKTFEYFFKKKIQKQIENYQLLIHQKLNHF